MLIDEAIQLADPLQDGRATVLGALLYALRAETDRTIRLAIASRMHGRRAGDLLAAAELYVSGDERAAFALLASRDIEFSPLEVRVCRAELRVAALEVAEQRREEWEMEQRERE